jgi:hypothetical protein
MKPFHKPFIMISIPCLWDMGFYKSLKTDTRQTVNAIPPQKKSITEIMLVINNSEFYTTICALRYKNYPKFWVYDMAINNVNPSVCIRKSTASVR